MNTWDAILQDAVGAEPLAQMLRPAIYLALAFGYGLLALSPRSARWSSPAAQQVWWFLLPVYLLATASSLVHGDVLFVLWAREQMRAWNLYESRRSLQVFVLAAAVLWVAARQRGALRQMAGFSLREWATPANVMALGLFATVGLFGLRYLSLHYTDRLLDYPLAGRRFALWLEGLALLLPACGTWLEWARYDEDV